MEVAFINEQKFLAELGKLLTFMYEEDRQTAIEMYADMFAATADEHALLLFLGSPTRQAVQVARAYNAKERKLQVHSQSKNEDGLEYDPDEVPDFVLAINKIAFNAAIISGGAALMADEVEIEEREAPEGQFSLFDDNSSEQEAAPEQAEVHISAEETAGEETVPAGEQADEAAEPAEEAAEAVPADAEAQEAAVDGTPAGAEAAEPAGQDAVDEFIDSFAIAPQPDRVEAPAEEPEAQTEAVEVPEEEPVPAVTETVRRPRVALLILYIILAVPITLIGVVLLLVPTVLTLGLAIGFAVEGAAALIAAFAGFAVFADILVMLGVSIIGLALGLLFLWLFIRLIVGGIIGLIKSAVALGGSWCYKEVPAV